MIAGTELRLRDTRAHAVRNVLGNVSILGTKSVSNLILAVEVRCHKVQGMIEAFTDTLYKRPCKNKQFSSPKSRILLLFSSETADKFAKDYAIKKKLPSYPALHLVTAHSIKLLTLFVLEIFG